MYAKQRMINSDLHNLLDNSSKQMTAFSRVEAFHVVKYISPKFYLMKLLYYDKL